MVQRIMECLDEYKTSIPDGVYLKLANLLNDEAKKQKRVQKWYNVYYVTSGFKHNHCNMYDIVPKVNVQTMALSDETVENMQFYIKKFKGVKMSVLPADVRRKVAIWDECEVQTREFAYLDEYDDDIIMQRFVMDYTVEPMIISIEEYRDRHEEDSESDDSDTEY